MRNLFVFSLILMFLAGCATTPPAPRSTVPKTTAAKVTTESAPSVGEPIQKVARPKATGTEEDARKHFLRGMAALEMAKIKDDLVLAIDEFRMATEISPQMAIAWYNMGKAQEQYGLFADAIESYKQYVENVPDAPDAQAVKDEIVKLEFRQEQLEKSEGRKGVWMGDDGTSYSLTVEGNKLILKANRHIPKEEVHSSYPFVPTVPNADYIPVEYQLILQGNRLSGRWIREAFTADKCPVPADASEVTGELIESEDRMVLSHQFTKFETFTQMSLFGSDYCGSIETNGRSETKVSIYGPKKRGGLGVELYGFTRWWDGGLSLIQFGWSGRLGVTDVKPGSPAYEAGLRDKDEILAIDGVAVKDLTGGQAWMRTMGDPGTPVTLEIWRNGEKESTIITFNRVELSKE